MTSRLRTASPWLLAAVLVAAGANHFVSTGAYEGLIPGWLGSPRFWVLSSGVAEIACGVLVAHPRTRRVGGWASLVLLVAVFPGNVTSAVNADSGLERLVTYARLPLQVPLVLWARQVAQDGGRRQTS